MSKKRDETLHLPRKDILTEINAARGGTGG